MARLVGPNVLMYAIFFNFFSYLCGLGQILLILPFLFSPTLSLRLVKSYAFWQMYFNNKFLRPFLYQMF